MTKKVRIIATPAGFAPERIRQDWVGIEIPLVTQSEADALQDEIWTSNEQHGGAIVTTADAITALTEAGKDEAADYWRVVQEQIGDRLRFGQEYCEMV